MFLVSITEFLFRNVIVKSYVFAHNLSIFF